MEHNRLAKFLEIQEYLDNVAKEFTLEQIEETLKKVEKEAPNSEFHQRLFMLYLTKRFRSNRG